MATGVQFISYWWLILLSGILLIVLGIGIFIEPQISYLTLCIVFALSIVIAGVLELLFSLASIKTIKGWGWLFFSSVIDISIGGYLLIYPLITATILPLVIGLWMVFRGLTTIITALTIRVNNFPDRILVLLAGVIIILFGIVIFANPVFGIISILLWSGLAFVSSGIFRVYLSFKLRQADIHVSDLDDLR